MKRHLVCLQIKFEAPKYVKLEMLSHRRPKVAIHRYNCHLSSLSLIAFNASPSLHIHTPPLFQVGLKKDGCS